MHPKTSPTPADKTDDGRDSTYWIDEQGRSTDNGYVQRITKINQEISKLGPKVEFQLFIYLILYAVLKLTKMMILFVHSKIKECNLKYLSFFQQEAGKLLVEKEVSFYFRNELQIFVKLTVKDSRKQIE